MHLKFLKFLLLLVLFSVFLVRESSGQASIGFTYEHRSSEPVHGLGIQLERTNSILVPFLYYRTRAHFSYFGKNMNDTSARGYDGGLAAMLGVNIGMISPYAGFGAGIKDNILSGGRSGTVRLRDNELYFQSMFGLRLHMLPAVKPFAELRFSGFNHTSDIFDAQQRILIGVALSF